VRQVLTGLAILAFSAAAPAVAGPQQQAQPQPQASQTNAPDDVICEREQDTGSRITGHKVCHTRTQWAEIRRDDRDATEQTQRDRPMDYNGH
jgi:invasion protein IalB